MPDPLARLSRNFGRRAIGRRIISAFRRRILPIAVLAEPAVRAMLVTWAADVGKREQQRRKAQKQTFLRRTSDIVADVAITVPEVYFGVLATAVDVLDAVTDKASEGTLEAIIDIPEEALRAAFETLSQIARAIRTGRRK